MIFVIAGTMFVLEGLGDNQGFTDSFAEAGMGGISFFQMVYFSCITISVRACFWMHKPVFGVPIGANFTRKSLSHDTR